MTKNTEPTKAMTVTEPAGALALPTDLAGAQGQGTEGIGRKDIRPPRLVLAQSGHPQTKKGNPKTIDGLHEGDLFNDLTRQNYGAGPIDVVIVKFLGKRAIEFYPMPPNGPGGIRDFQVPIDDPRTKFTTDADGKTVKPKATVFFEYLAWLPASQEMVAVSMKNTQTKVAKDLNTLLTYPLVIDKKVVAHPQAWARTFSLGTAMETRNGYTFANFTLTPKGITDPELRELAQTIFESLAGKTVVVDVTDEGGAETVEADAPHAEKVPF